MELIGLVVALGEEKAKPNRVRELRKRAGLSQKDLAIALGLSDTSIQNYEYRKRRIPGHVLVSMADYFNVSIDYILMVTDDPIRHTGSNNIALVMSTDEKELLSLYRSLPERGKHAVLAGLRDFAEQSKGE